MRIVEGLSNRAVTSIRRQEPKEEVSTLRPSNEGHIGLLPNPLLAVASILAENIQGRDDAVEDPTVSWPRFQLFATMFGACMRGA